MNVETPRAVFLSYASQDAEAARGICEALRAAGVEVWFDQSELRGGDAWDQKIRRQIRDCALIIAVISANTQRRREGYFRLEWHLAEQRSHLIARGSPFIVPVAIDGTADADALVPDAFLAVQWMRLRNGAPTPEFIAQMKRLLEGSPAPAPAEAGRARAGPPPTERRANRRAGMIIGALGVVVAVAAVCFGLRSHSGGAGAAGPNSSASPPTAGVAAGTAAASGQPPLSEARQLAEKARALFEKWDSTTDDFTAADSMMKRALELDSNDASIWAYSSELNSAFDSRGFDKSPARSAASRSQAERAMKLAPGSSEALYALGYWQAHNDPDPKVAESTYERVLKIAPGDARADMGLAQLYILFLGRTDDGFALLRRAAAQPDRTALACYLEFLDYFYCGRFAEADREIRRSVAAGPAANNQGGLALNLLTWKGDVDGAARSLDAVPEAERDEHRTVWMTAYTQLLQRKPDEALKTLGRLPDDFIVDSWFVGPKAYWEGRAQALAGRADAARLSWEAGLAVTEKRLKEDPTSRSCHLMRAQLLALLGRTDEALVETRTFAELSSGELAFWDYSPALVYAELGRAEDALPLIAALLAKMEKHGPSAGWPLTPALLKIDPVWDPLRGDPRFRKLVADADETERAAAPPRDWPKDPDLKRAFGILDKTDAIEEDYRLAEDIAKGALANRPTDPEAVIVMARIQVWYLIRGFDVSQERRVQAKRYAERAIQLAPDDPEALAAMGEYLYASTGEFPRAEGLLRKALELEPQNPVYRRYLGAALAADPTANREDTLAVVKQNAALFPHDALTQYDTARVLIHAFEPLAECEAALDRTIAVAPLANALDYRAWFALWDHGDPAVMKSWLDRVPEKTQSLERIIFSRYACAFFGGRWQEGIDALDSFPGPWMDDFEFRGPPGFLAGMMLGQLGKTELARLKFEGALAELERHKAQEPSRVFPAEPWILMALGRSDQAKASNRLVQEATPRPYRLGLYSNWLFTSIPLSLLLGERDQALALIKETSVDPNSRLMLRTAMAIDRRMAPFRNDPEIAALIAEPAAQPKNR